MRELFGRRFAPADLTGIGRNGQEGTCRKGREAADRMMGCSDKRRSRARLRRKLSSRAGETITEVLAATVVVSLGSILLASMVTSSKGIITKSQRAYEDYLTERNYIESRGESATGGANPEDVALTVGTPEKISISVKKDGSSYQIPVKVISTTAKKQNRVIFKEYQPETETSKQK